MSQSDIALVASIDFSKADTEVNQFVERSQKKLSEIMQKAQSKGGSLSAANRIQPSMVGPSTNIAAARRELGDMSKLWNAYSQIGETNQRKLERAVVGSFLRMRGMNEGNIKLAWALMDEDRKRRESASRENIARNRREQQAGLAQLRQEAAERARLDREASSRRAALAATESRAARTATAERKKQADIEAAYAQQASTKRAQEDALWTAQEKRNREARLAETKSANERTKRELSGFYAHVKREQEIATRRERERMAAGIALAKDEAELRKRVASDASARVQQINASAAQNEKRIASERKKQADIEAAYAQRNAAQAADREKQMEAMWAAQTKARQEASKAVQKATKEEIAAYEAQQRVLRSSTARIAAQSVPLGATAAGRGRIDSANLARDNFVAKAFGSDLEWNRRVELAQRATDAAKKFNDALQNAPRGSMAAQNALRDYRNEMATLNRELTYGTKEAKLNAAAQKQVLDAAKQASQERARAARENIVSGIAGTRSVGNAENAALGVKNRIGRQLGFDPALQADLTKRVDAALRAYTTTVQTFGARSLEAARATVTWNRELTNVRSVIAEKGGLLRTLNANAERLRGTVSDLGNSFGGLGRMAMNTQVALSALMAAFGLREIIATMVELERFSNTLRTVSGSVTAFQENMRFLFAEANRIGFSVSEVGNSFARLSIAMRGAGFSGEETRQAFTGLTEASRNFGISSADTMGIIRALEQSMSKGKFMAEEVRLQMGDRLPIAMAALTRAMEIVDGKVVDVNKRFEEGTIDVERYALEFVRQINAMSGGAEALSRTSNSIGAAFGRLSTAFTEFVQKLEAGGFGQAVISVTEQITKALQAISDSSALRVLGEVALVVANNFTVFATAVIALGTAFAASKILSGIVTLAGWLLQLSPAGRVITAAVAGLTLLSGLWASGAASAESSARSIGQALNTVRRSSENMGAEMQEATSALANGIATTTQQAESNFQRLVRGFRNMGDDMVTAMRRATEEMIRMQEAQNETNRNLLRQAERDYQNYVSRNLNLRRIEGQFASNERRMVEFAGPSNSDTQRLNQITTRAREMIELARQGNTDIAAIGANLRQLQEAANADFLRLTATGNAAAIEMGMQFSGVATAIGDLITNLGRLNNADLSKIASDLERLRGLVATGAQNATVMRQALTNPDPGPVYGSEGVGNVSTPGVRPIRLEDARTQRQRTAENNLRRALGEAGALGQRDAEGRPPALGAAPALGNRTGALDPQTMLGFLRQRSEQGNAAATELLKQYDEALKDARDSAQGLRDAVAELMEDMERQADAASRDGAAAQAYADAQNRVADAASRAGRSVASATEQDRAKELVTRRLNAETAVFIAQSDRQSRLNGRIAAGYRQSAEAGQQAEIVARAYIEALRFAPPTIDENGEATGDYRKKIEELIPVIERAERSERNLAAARQIDQNRDEIAVLEREGQLIGANTALREEELAVLRARQQHRNASSSDLDEIERQTRQMQRMRRENEMMNNSWQELTRIGEQAFDRIGEAITEAFTKGEKAAVNFKNIAKAIVSEVSQAFIRMAFVNPILNTMDGGTRGTLSGLFNVVGGASPRVPPTATGASQGGGFGGITQMLGLASGVNNLTGGSLTNSLGLSGIGERISGWLGLGGSGINAAGAATNAAGYGSMAQNSIDMFGSAQAAGLNSISGGLSSTAMGAMGVAGGAYGIYSGTQKGGIGGGLMAAGGAAGIAAGLGTMGIGASLGLVAAAPYLAPVAIALALLGSMTPGQKPSNKEGNATYNFGTGSMTIDGQTGGKFSQENRDAARDATRQIVDMVRQIASASNATLNMSEVKVGVGDRDGIYSIVNRGTMREYDRNEDGVNRLISDVVRTAIEGMQGGESDNLRTAIRRVNPETPEQIVEIATWFTSVYNVLGKTTDATKSYNDAITALLKPYDEAISKAREYGLSVDQLERNRARALDRNDQDRAWNEWSTINSLEGRAAEANSDRGRALWLREMQFRYVDAPKQRRDLEDQIEVGAFGPDAAQAIRRRLDEAISAEIEAFTLAWEDMWENQRRTIRSFDLRLSRASAAVAGTGQAAFAQQLLEFDESASQEIFDTKRTLRELGFAASDVEEEVVKLVQAHALERQAIVQNLEARKSAANDNLRDRYQAATLNMESLSSRLLVFDRDAARERLEASREGLVDMVQLEKTLSAERLKVMEDFTDSAREGALNTIESLRDYVKELSTAEGTGTALDRYEVARNRFTSVSNAASLGDARAIGEIRQAAEVFRQTSREVYGGGQGYADALRTITDSIAMIGEMGEEALTQSFLRENAKENTDRVVGAIEDLVEENKALRREIGILLSRPVQRAA